MTTTGWRHEAAAHRRVGGGRGGAFLSRLVSRLTSRLLSA